MKTTHFCYERWTIKEVLKSHVCFKIISLLSRMRTGGLREPWTTTGTQRGAHNGRVREKMGTICLPRFLPSSWLAVFSLYWYSPAASVFTSPPCSWLGPVGVRLRSHVTVKFAIGLQRGYRQREKSNLAPRTGRGENGICSSLSWRA